MISPPQHLSSQQTDSLRLNDQEGKREVLSVVTGIQGDRLLDNPIPQLVNPATVQPQVQTTPLETKA
jgi:hypothetical protein